MSAVEVGVWVPLRASCRLLPRSGGLYVLRCTVNGKLYVGKSINIHLRAYKHCRPRSFTSLIARAVRVHGAEAFEIMVWSLGDDEPALLAAEIELIEHLGARAPAGYNLTAGGEGSRGYRHPPEVIARIAAANTGKVRPAGAVAATAAANRGKVRSAESLVKISAAHTGRVRSVESRAKQSLAMKGRVLGPGVQEKMTASLRNNPKVIANAQRMGLARRRVVLMWPPGSMVAVEFESVQAAARLFGKTASDVSNYCRGCVPKSRHRFAYLE